MTKIRKIYHFAKTINSGDFARDLELAQSIIDEIDIMEDYATNGDVELAEGHATHIIERAYFTEAFIGVYEQYVDNGDVIGLLDGYKQIVKGEFR